MIGLYYPYIHFEDDSWLKLAALYWDKMARIVPYDYTTEDSDDVKKLMDAEFIRNYGPDEREIEEVSRVFDDLVGQHEAELLSQYSVHQRDTWQGISRYRYPSRSAVRGLDPRMEYIYVGKLGHNLSSHLRQVGLAEYLPYDPNWVGMHPRLAFVYMSALAEKMAQQRTNLYPVTENALYHLAVSGLTMERLAQALLDPVHLPGPVHTDREIEAHLAMISFEDIRPKYITQVPVEKIIMLRNRLRDKYGDELESYQNYLHTLISAKQELEQATNLTTLQDILKDEYVHKIGPKLRDLKKELRLLNIDTITGAMNLKFEVPSVLTTGAVVLGMALQPIIAAAGAIAMGVLKIVGDKKKKNDQARQSSQVTWLLRVEQGLGPERLLAEISQEAGKFHFPK